MPRGKDLSGYRRGGSLAKHAAVGWLLAGLVIVLGTGVAVADCNININIDPSNGAGVYIYNVTAGEYVVEGLVVDPYNGPLTCDDIYQVWVEKDGHTFDVKSAHGWSINPAGDIASGTATKQTQNLHFNGDVVVANNPPVAVLGDYEICEGESVTLDGSGSYDNDSADTLQYRWDLDGGGFDTGWSASPTHTFSPPSTVTVTLEVRDLYDGDPTGATDTDTGVVTVIVCCESPVVTSHPGSLDLCEGETATFSATASGTAPLSYQWKKNGSSIPGATGATYSIASVAPSDAGSYTVTVSNDCGEDTSNAAVLTVQSGPTVDAGAGGSICESESASLSGSASNYATVQWTTGGDGSFANSAALSTTYTPGSSDITAGTVTLTLTAQPVSPCPDSVSDTVVWSIQREPTAAAGSDVEICEGEVAPLAGSASDYATVQWTTGGDGSFGNPGSLSTTYTPGLGDIAAGTVTLTLTAEPAGPCSEPATDTLVVTIQRQPTADAGAGGSICESESASLAGSASDYATVQWTTGGDGSFGNAGALSTDYTPGSGDIAAGTVTLTLTAQPVSPCADPASDSVEWRIQRQPASAAGSDVGICEGETASLSGSASDYASVQWTSSGDGSFGNPGSLSTTYTPGSGDIAAGAVTLTLTAEAASPCGEEATDDLVVTIQGQPTADAGAGGSICESEPVSLSGSASNYATVQWATGGDGSFGNTGSLSTDYTPGSGDIAAGTVTLTLTAQPVSPCADPASDSVEWRIQRQPASAAGSDVEICEGEVAPLAGSASDYATVQWTTDGDGSFGNPGSLSTTYTPGSGDIAAGAVTLSLTAEAASPCGEAATDDLVVTIRSAAAAAAGADVTICPDETVSLSGSASSYTTVQWSTSGDGSFGNTGSLSTDYTPGSGDIASGSVTLTLTAQPVSPCGEPASDALVVTIDVCNRPPEATNLRLETCALGTGGSPRDEWLTFRITITDPEIDPQAHPISLNFHAIEFPADEMNVRYGAVWGDLSDVSYGPGPTASIELTYVPPADFIGQDLIRYVVVDPFGASARGRIVIDVVDCRTGAGGAASAAAINEVAWGGTDADSEHEWIELIDTRYGPELSAVSLDGWILAWRHRRAVDERPERIRNIADFRGSTPPEERWEVPLEGFIDPGGYYLLERHVEDVVSDLDADLVYAGGEPYDRDAYRLSDLLGEEIYLFDAEGNVASSANIDYSVRPPGGAPWPAGSVDGAAVASMERNREGSEPYDLDEEWDTNLGIIIAGLDARSDLLTATAATMNEALVVSRLHLQSPPWVEIVCGERLTLSFALRDWIEPEEGLPRVSVIQANGPVGGGGSLDTGEIINILRILRRRGVDPNVVLELDTTLLPAGEYHLFVTMGSGVFHYTGVRVMAR